MSEDSEDDAVESLERLGLSQYEANVFAALVKLGTGTASDVDQITDVPRSQVYGAAESLDERGLVEIQQSTPIRYRPVGLEEARDRLRQRYEDREQRAFDYLHGIESRRREPDEQQEDVWMTHGGDSISARTKQLVADADEEVLYGGGPDALDEDLVETLLAAAATGVDVTVVSADTDVLAQFRPEEDVMVRPFPAELTPENQRTGRILVVDGDTLLLSVHGEEDLPSLQTETALWSSETGFATIIVRLLDTWLDEHLEH
jgi:sugar-specific transcriptional regulator TrmB